MNMPLLAGFSAALAVLSFLLRAWILAWVRALLKGTEIREIQMSFLPRAAVVSWLVGLWVFALYAILNDRLIAGGTRFHGTLLLAWAQLLTIGAVAAVLSRRELSPRSSNSQVIAWSAFLGLPLLCVPAIVAISHNRYADLSWFHYEFTDKRWLIASYVLVTCLVLLIPAISSRLFVPKSENPLPPPRRSPIGPRLGVVFFAVVLACWMYGPPWNLRNSVQPIELHELVHLGPLQAIATGQLPYAEAQSQYGPGIQALSYLYMKWTRFDLVHLREVFALFLFTSALAAFVGYALLLPPIFAFGAIVFSAISASPFTLFGFEKGRIFSGFFGWSNPWRFESLFLVLGAFHWAYWKIESARRRAAVSLIAGLVWGALAWYSQENLPSTLTALGIYSCLLAMLGPRKPSEILRQAAFVLLGFFAVWGIVLGSYAAHGAAKAYLTNYFMISALVAQGYTNIPFDDGYWQLSYWVTPYLAWICGILATVDFRARRLFSKIDEESAIIVAGAAMVLGGYQNALFRSDPPHLLITLLGLPVLIFGSLAVLPGRIFRLKTRGFRLATGVGLLALVTMAYPIKVPKSLRPTRFPDLLSHSRRSVAFESSAISRLGTDFGSSTPCCHNNRGTLGEFVKTMDAIHAFCGSRTAVVDSFVDSNGYVYFFADLRPALFFTEAQHFVFNSTQLRKYEQMLQERAYDCVVSMDPGSTAVEVFKKKHPGFEEARFVFDQRTVSAFRK